MSWCARCEEVCKTTEMQVAETRYTGVCPFANLQDLFNFINSSYEGKIWWQAFINTLYAVYKLMIQRRRKGKVFIRTLIALISGRLTVSSYLLMDSLCTGIWPSRPRCRLLPVWHRSPWRCQAHLSPRPPAARPPCPPSWGFAWAWKKRTSRHKLIRRGATQSPVSRRLPGHDFGGGRSAGVDGQRVRLLGHGRADETTL